MQSITYPSGLPPAPHFRWSYSVWVTRSVAAKEGKCRYLSPLRLCCATKHYCGLRWHFWPSFVGRLCNLVVSQYVMVVADSGFAESGVAVVPPVNAVSCGQFAIRRGPPTYRRQ